MNFSVQKMSNLIIPLRDLWIYVWLVQNETQASQCIQFIFRQIWAACECVHWRCVKIRITATMCFHACAMHASVRVFNYFRCDTSEASKIYDVYVSAFGHEKHIVLVEQKFPLRCISHQLWKEKKEGKMHFLRSKAQPRNVVITPKWNTACEHNYNFYLLLF